VASTYKKKRDQKKKHACWYIDYFDHNHERRTVKGFTDKSKTEQLAAKLESEVRLRKMGMIDPQQEDLVRLKQSSTDDHLRDFEKSLSRKKNSPKHVKLTMSRIRSVTNGCEFKTLGEIDAETTECYLEETQEERDFGHRTYNHYVQAIQQFCTWLVEKKRLTANPVAGIPRLNCATDVRSRRRALTPVEFEALVKAARQSTELIQCYDGETRARIYIVSYMTGLRRGEIASLTPSSFKLDDSPPTVTVAATISKHRRMDVLPLHRDLVVMLRDWIQGRQPDEVLVPKLAKRRTWLMVKKDLEKAGIPYQTAEGVADYHAAGRHTHITELLRNGATVPEAMKLARHTDIAMAMKYAHIGIEDQAKALAGLPNPCPHIVSISPDSEGQSEAKPVIDRQSSEVSGSDVNAATSATSDTTEQKKAPDDSDALQWRRRELNPRPAIFPRQHLRV
jgi:integrase